MTPVWGKLYISGCYLMCVTLNGKITVVARLGQAEVDALRSK